MTALFDFIISLLTVLNVTLIDMSFPSFVRPCSLSHFFGWMSSRVPAGVDWLCRGLCSVKKGLKYLKNLLDEVEKELISK
jgi:hypothetical protein